MSNSFEAIVKTYTDGEVRGVATVANNLGENIHVLGVSLLNDIMNSDAQQGAQTGQIKAFFDSIKTKSCHRAPFKRWIEANSPVKIIEKDGVVTKVTAKGWDTYAWNLQAAHDAPHYEKTVSDKPAMDIEALKKYLSGKNDKARDAGKITPEVKLMCERLLAEVAKLEAEVVSICSSQRDAQEAA